ncbi:MAG: hypothetical protein ACLPKB_31695 [Xanthobacteraceae bacterium]
MTARRCSLTIALSLVAPWLVACGLGASGQTRPEPSAGVANPAAAQSLDHLSATRERPLFSPSRRPPPPPPAPVAQRAAPVLPPAAPSVDLFGIVSDEEGARAVVRTGPGNKILRVRVGDEIGGWKVSQIEGRKLVLSLGERSTTFTLFSGHNAKPDVQILPRFPDRPPPNPTRASSVRG